LYKNKVVVTTTSGIQEYPGFIFASLSDMQNFIATAQKQVDKVKGTGSKLSDHNTASRLQELTKIHQLGLITQQEFQQKRSEIIDHL